MPVIHVYRDPRAIVASIKNTRWHWLTGHLLLKEQLLDPADGRAEYFNRWRSEILEYDKKDDAARITAYWALTETFVQYSFADGPSRIIFVSYEELARRRERLLWEILNKLSVRDIPTRRFRVLEADSSTTVPTRRGAALKERISGWKTVLSHPEIALIESIAQRFGFEARLVNDEE